MEYIDDEEEELPALNEGDEALSLYDILVERDACLNEEELWALCRECCLVLEVVNNSPEMFQTLCITPDTVAFDRAGNVCFLDLDKDPESLYIPPEYDNVGNSYKSHLFSLGMTLLYGAEYNGEPGRPEISAELRELFGCMTSEDFGNRPDLESVITECEEQLCGKSSQEVCCNIGTFESPFTPAPDVNSVSLTDVTEGLSDYLNSQSSLIPVSGANSVTLPGPQEHSTPTVSPFKSPQQRSVDNSPYYQEYGNAIDTTDVAADAEGNMPVRGMLTGMPLPTGNRERNSNRKRNKGLSVSNNLNFSTNPNEILRSNLSSNVTRNTSDLRAEVFTNTKVNENNNTYSESSDLKYKKDGAKPPLPRKPSKSDLYKKSDNDSGMVDDNYIHSEIETSIGDRISHILDGADKLHKPVSQTGEEKQSFGQTKGIPPVAAGLVLTESNDSSSADVKEIKRSKKKQGLTISEIVDSLNRDLCEEELWALCKEGTSALRRKKKHLPAYLSPDTLLLRENGNLSFKAIPEDKPLEVIFMAPELQQRGQLSDKTCLYGLGVTLRCAAGKKYASATSMLVSPVLQNLLERLGESDPAKRPTLEETTEMCELHESDTGTSSTIICKDLFQEAFTKLMDESVPQAPPPDAAPVAPVAPVAMPKPKPKLPPKPPSPMLSAFRPIKGPGIKPQIGTSSSSFSSVKPETEQNPNGAMPSAFTSSATHFRPIVIHSSSAQTQSADNTQNQTEQEDCQPNDKDKEVVRKLKELKKNLMKHRQPMASKDLDNDDKENNSVDKKNIDSKKAQLPQLPKHVEDSSEKTEKKSTDSGAIQSLLEEIQKQGSMPDTQSLASAIAQHLQGHLKQAETKSPPIASHLSAPSPMYPPQGVGLPPAGQIFPQYAQHLTGVNIPAHQHQQLLGQTMTLPSLNQYSGGLMPGYPLQVQLQQDPRTGFIQMVPVGIMPVGSTQGSQANSDEFVNVHDDVTRMSDPGRSPMLRTKYSSEENGSDTMSRKRQRSNIRTPKDLDFKEVNDRSSSIQQTLSNSSNMVGQPQRDTGWHTVAALGVEQSDIGHPESDMRQFTSQDTAFKSNSGQKIGTSNHGQYCVDDSVEKSVPKSNVAHGNSGGAYNNTLQPQRTRSNSSSPSPSKDSGVSGMNGVYKPPPPGSLMERLLNSNVSLSQQKKIGRIVHLLREEYAFDGYMENGVEDINMAEYILSLGNLKWETFASAITEKYSDLYWKVDLLVNLYQAVNGSKPMIQNQLHGQGRVPMLRSSELTELPPPNVTRAKTEENDDMPSSVSQKDKSRTYKRQTTTDMVMGGSRDTVMPHRPQSVNAATVDTSDSTDNENFEHRRRYRKKHLEKSKSSSMHNLASPVTLTVASSEKTEEDIDTNKNNVNISSEPDNTQFACSSQNQEVHHDTKPGIQTECDTNSQGVIASNLQSQKHEDHTKHESSVSSRSSSVSDVRGATKLTRHMSRLSLSEDAQETATHLRRTHILFHYTMLQLNMTQEIEKFIQDIDEENPDSLQLKLASLEQETMMQRRTKKKTQTFFNKLTDQPKPMKSDQKNMATQVSKDLNEMSEKIRHLSLCKTHIEMLQAELHSIDPSYLNSLVTCPIDSQLKLKPCQENLLLQFQVLREPQTGCEVNVVNAGTIDGLISYLFATTSLSFGYIHQFFYGFRYFTTPEYLLKFFINHYKMVTRVKVLEANHQRVQRRVIDLLHFWIEGFYSIDFEDKSEILQEMQMFLQQNKIAVVSDDGGKLQELFNMCQDGNNLDLMSNTCPGENVHVYKPGAPKKWDSVKAMIGGKSSSKDIANSKMRFSMCVDQQSNSHTMEDVYFPKTARRTDAFALADYTSQTIAEQLTLIEQGIFQMTHPVHYLNSKSQGVSVALTMSMTRAPSLLRLNNSPEESQQIAPSLFVSHISQDCAVQRMIDHAHEVSHWVAGEIVSCSTSKSQVAVLSKFLHTALACKEMRNYATCMAILDGLENLIIKQLPAWKNLPSKCITIMEELNSVRMFLKNDGLSLMKHADSHLYPTIPAVLLFLLHVQQKEIGNFQLANEMYKWSKIRSITQVIDQIRIFKDHIYGYDADYDIQDTLMQRIREFSGRDIHAIASQHDTNYQKISTGGIGAAFRKMKGKFQSK